MSRGSRLVSGSAWPLGRASARILPVPRPIPRVLRSLSSPTSTPGLVRRWLNKTPVKAQRVQLGYGGVRLRNVLVGALVVYGCYRLYIFAVVGPLDAYLEKVLEGESGDAEEEEDFEPFFIPFPFTQREVQPPPYRGSDPEWQEFVRISKDKPLLSRIRQELGEHVRKSAEAHSLLSIRLGKSFKMRRSWLDVDYPYRPPPEYVRSGLLLTDEALEWATRPVDPHTATMVNRILYPYPMALSAFAFTGALFKQDFLNVARWFGYDPSRRPQLPGPLDPKSPSQLPTPNPTVPQAFQELQRQATRRPGDIKDPSDLPSADQQGPDGSPTAGSSASRTLPPSGPDGRIDGQDPNSPGNKEKFIGHGTIRSNVAGPWQEFRKAFTKSWKPQRDPPPRGSVLVSGLVELEGPKAWIVIDVAAFWDPKTRKFDTKSMYMHLRRVQMKRQSPQRG